jgi:hypothetical protein
MDKIRPFMYGVQFTGRLFVYECSFTTRVQEKHTRQSRVEVHIRQTGIV